MFRRSSLPAGAAVLGLAAGLLAGCGPAGLPDRAAPSPAPASGPQGEVHRFLDGLTATRVAAATSSGTLWHAFLTTNGRGRSPEEWLRTVFLSPVPDAGGPPLVLVSWMKNGQVDRQTLYTYPGTSRPVRQPLAPLLGNGGHLAVSLAPSMLAEGRFEGRPALLAAYQSGHKNALGLFAWNGHSWSRPWSLTAPPQEAFTPLSVDSFRLGLVSPVTYTLATAAGGVTALPAVSPGTTIPYWTLTPAGGTPGGPVAPGSRLTVSGWVPYAWTRGYLTLNWEGPGTDDLITQWAVRTAPDGTFSVTVTVPARSHGRPVPTGGYRLTAALGRAGTSLLELKSFVTVRPAGR